MNLFEIQPGMVVETKDGGRAEVVENMGDGQWLMVRWLHAPRHPETVGEEELCHAEAISSFRTA